MTLIIIKQSSSEVHIQEIVFKNNYSTWEQKFYNCLGGSKQIRGRTNMNSLAEKE